MPTRSELEEHVASPRERQDLESVIGGKRHTIERMEIEIDDDGEEEDCGAGCCMYYMLMYVLGCAVTFTATVWILNVFTFASFPSFQVIGLIGFLVPLLCLVAVRRAPSCNCSCGRLSAHSGSASRCAPRVLHRTVVPHTLWRGRMHGYSRVILDDPL